MKLYLLGALVATANATASCTASTVSFDKNNTYGVKILRTWAPIEVDCPTKGGKPKVALIAFNMGGAAGKTKSSLHVSMAASLKGGAGTTGLAVKFGKSESTTAPTGGAFDGKSARGRYKNGRCSGGLRSVNKACATTLLSDDSDGSSTRYLSVWNTGGCNVGSKLIIEASAGERDVDQHSTCLGKLVEIGAPRSGNPDDLYCNVGTGSTCGFGTYDEIPCGKISAGYKCVRSATYTITVGSSKCTRGLCFKPPECTSGSLSCQPKAYKCPEVTTTLAPINGITMTAAAPCLTCNKNDCFSKEFLTGTTNPIYIAAGSGDTSKIVISILGFAIAVNFIFA